MGNSISSQKDTINKESLNIIYEKERLKQEWLKTIALDK